MEKMVEKMLKPEQMIYVKKQPKNQPKQIPEVKVERMLVERMLSRSSIDSWDEH